MIATDMPKIVWAFFYGAIIIAILVFMACIAAYNIVRVSSKLHRGSLMEFLIWSVFIVAAVGLGCLVTILIHHYLWVDYCRQYTCTV